MPRYSRVRGPTVNFELPAVRADVPGMAIERYWDDGELLILYGANCSNQSSPAAEVTFQMALQLDGVDVPGAGLTDTVPSTDQRNPSKALLHPIAAGVHQLSIQAAGVAQGGDRILAGSCYLIVIQLPLWDDAGNLVDL